MQKPKSFLRVFTESGPLIALAVAVALLVGIVGPASAQFFNFGNFGGPPRAGAGAAQQWRRVGGWFGGDLFAPFQQQQQQAPKRVENFSKAPPPEKRDNAIMPERNVLVLGDAMADWLAYGLEDAYSEQPDMGVIRKHKTVSGLIKYQPKGEPADWAAAAKGILATEKPDAIVVMLGLNDRIAMREPAADKSDGKATDKKARKTPNRMPSRRTPSRREAGWRGRRHKARRQAGRCRSPPTMRPTTIRRRSSRRRRARARRSGLYEFREERWVELYSQEDR